MANSLKYRGGYLEKQTISTTAQNFTGSWVDYGSEIDVLGITRLGLWLNLDVNDSNNMRVRVLAKHTTAGTDEYMLPIKTVSSSDVKVEDEYLEFNADSDQKVLLSVELFKLVAYVQIQIQVGTVGSTAGQVDSGYYTLVSNE